MKALIESPWCPHDCIQRLLQEYKKYEKLIVAFDFDNTIFDYHNSGADHSEIIELLQACTIKGFTMILFTCDDDPKSIEWKKLYCDHFGIRVDYVNESPIIPTRKPFYNILLDDRAGLQEAANTLNSLLNRLEDADNQSS